MTHRYTWSWCQLWPLFVWVCSGLRSSCSAGGCPGPATGTDTASPSSTVKHMWLWTSPPGLSTSSSLEMDRSTQAGGTHFKHSGSVRPGSDVSELIWSQVGSSEFISHNQMRLNVHLKWLLDRLSLPCSVMHIKTFHVSLQRSNVFFLLPGGSSTYRARVKGRAEQLTPTWTPVLNTCGQITRTRVHAYLNSCVPSNCE